MEGKKGKEMEAEKEGRNEREGGKEERKTDKLEAGQ